MSEATILDVAELDLHREDYDWPFARERADEIGAHWQARSAKNPALFDGRVLLMFRHQIDACSDGSRILSGGYFETAYSNFLAWRDFGFPDREVCNGFAMAALQSADGAYLLGEMAAHTANAGEVYFAAGTPDPSDVFDGRVDLTASVMRELEEETGISPSETTIEPGWTLVYMPPKLACMKAMRLNFEAEAAKARIEAFLARETKPELKRMHIVRSLADLEGKSTPDFMRAFLASALRG